MNYYQFQVGDRIEVIDESIAPHPMRGEIVELDIHPSPAEPSYAKIVVDSPALPQPVVWVNLRLARLEQKCA